MTRLRVLLARLRSLARSRRRDRALDQALDEEIETHLALLAEDLIRQGRSPEEARAAARAAFGGVEQIKESYRDQRGIPLLESLAQDVRSGIRLLRRSPGFAAVVVVTLALGIGANTAVFAVIDALLLRDLPVARPQELVRLFITNPQGSDDTFSYSAFQQLRQQGTPVAEIVAASGSRSVAATVNGEPEVIVRKSASGDYFRVLGVRATAGRLFTAEDDAFNASRAVAVLSHRCWTQRFGGDIRAIGRTIVIGETTFTIIGVTGPGFFGETVGEQPDVWTPLRVQPGAPGDLWTGHSTTWLRLLGRRRPGVDVQQVGAALAPIFARIAQENAAGMRVARFRKETLQSRLDVRAASRGRSPARDPLSHPLFISMALVGLVLVIACANIANLLLARAAVRRRELSLRMALGAGRRRLVRQLLVESLLLAALGGAVGLVVGFGGGRALVGLASQTTLPLRIDVRPDLRLLAFTAGLSLVTALLFGLVPALRAVRPNMAATLKQGGPGVATSGFRLGRAIVVAQIALSLVLLIGAGLFVRSLLNLRNIDLGFVAPRVLVLELDGPPAAAAVSPEQRADVYARLVQRAELVPGVEAASVSFFGLFSAGRWGNRITVEGREVAPDEPDGTQANAIAPRYFEVMGIRLLRGRPFARDDRADTQRVAIVNQTFARQFFGGAVPIGWHVGLGAPAKAMMTIVGVVADAKYGNLRERATPMLYVPFTQYPAKLNVLQVRTATQTVTDPGALVSQLRRELAAVDRRITVVRVSRMQDQVDASIAGERLIAKLASVFGLLALLLSAVGVYGVVAYLSAQRTVELGIRMALGARRPQVLWLVLRQVLVLVVAGGLAGTVVAILASRLVVSQLHGLTPHDPVTIVLALVALASAALAAGCIPASRATRIDPVIALRAE